MMTLKQFRERFAPLVQWPVAIHQATWLDADALQWSLQYPGVLDAGVRAFEHLRKERDRAARVLQLD